MNDDNPFPIEGVPVSTYVACEFCGEVTMRWFIVNLSPTTLLEGDLTELHGRLARGEGLRDGIHGDCAMYPDVFVACHVCGLEAWERGATVEDWNHPSVAAAKPRLGDPITLGGFTGWDGFVTDDDDLGDGADSTADPREREQSCDAMQERVEAHA